MKQKMSVPNVSFLDLIYPPKCGICGKLNDNFLCNKCYLKLKNDSKFTIEENKKEEKEKEYKEDKTNRNEYNRLLYMFKYEGMIRNIILKYKFQDKSYLYKTIVNFLLKNEKLFEIIKTYDTIVPVPISKKRKKTRGYNQSYLIAREIAVKSGMKINNKCLFKTKNIIEQSKLNKEERLNNIKGVYKLKNSYGLENKKILLIDDIYTTGSTVNECCKILKKARPKGIDVLVIAKD